MRRKKKIAKLESIEIKTLVEMVNNTPSLKVFSVPKSLQKGYTDLPLFFVDNQLDLFRKKEGD